MTCFISRDKLTDIFSEIKTVQADGLVMIMEQLNALKVNWVRGFVFQGEVFVTRPVVKVSGIPWDLYIIDGLTGYTGFIKALELKDGIPEQISLEKLNQLSSDHLFLAVPELFSGIKVTSSSLPRKLVDQRQGKPPAVRPPRNKAGLVDKPVKIMLSDGTKLEVEKEPERTKEKATPVATNLGFKLGSKRRAFTKKKGKVKVQNSKFQKKGGKNRGTKGF